MKLTSKLLLLSAANLLIACALFVLHPEFSEFKTLGLDLRGQVASDSSRFMEQAWTVVHSNLPLYDTLFFERHIKFIYPTSSLLIDSAAQALHIPLGPLLKWLVLLSAALTLFFAGDCFLRILPPAARANARTWQVRLLIASLGLFFYPIVLSVGLGQIQTFLTFLFTLAVWFWLRGEKVFAGFCLALVCTFKPPLALFLLWAVLRRQWSFFWTFAASVVLIQTLSGLLFGWRNEVGYLAVLSYLSRHGEIIAENQSVNGLLERWLANGTPGTWTDTSPYPAYNAVVYVGTLLSSAIFLLFGLLVPVLRRWQGTASDFVLFGLISTIASPIVWTHHYGFFYIGCIYFLAVSLKQTGRIAFSFAASFLVLANFWRILGRLQGRLWTPLFSYDLFAGLAIILLIAFGLEHADDAPAASTPSAEASVLIDADPT
jgi:alpha-1,2-mannosyltransferase